jgi:hypothetical protein
MRIQRAHLICHISDTESKRTCNQSPAGCCIAMDGARNNSNITSSPCREKIVFVRIQRTASAYP